MSELWEEFRHQRLYACYIVRKGGLCGGSVRFAAVQYGWDCRLYIMFDSTSLRWSRLKEARTPAWKRESEQRAVQNRSGRMAELELWREWSVVS